MNFNEVKRMVMRLAHRIEKNEKLTKSDANKRAWLLARTAIKIVSEDAVVKSVNERKTINFLHGLNTLADIKEYEKNNKVICFNFNYWNTVYNWSCCILVMARSKEDVINWANSMKDFVFDDCNIDVVKDYQVFHDKACVKVF